MSNLLKTLKHGALKKVHCQTLKLKERVKLIYLMKCVNFEIILKFYSLTRMNFLQCFMFQDFQQV